MESKVKKAVALAFACALMPVTACTLPPAVSLPSQQVPMPPVPLADLPPPMQAAPVAPQPGAVGSVSDDAQPAPDPYADSQRKLFFSTMTLSAARIGSGAGCGVITPGVGMQTMSDLEHYVLEQYGYSSEDAQMVDAYNAAFKFRACSVWRDDPNLVAWLRQMGQTAMDATQAAPQLMSAVPQYSPDTDFPSLQSEIKSDDAGPPDDSSGDFGDDDSGN
jgi:hypothetical protein